MGYPFDGETEFRKGIFSNEKYAGEFSHLQNALDYKARRDLA